MRPVHLATSKDELRPILKYIQIKDGLVNATNGYMLASLPVKEVFDDAISKDEELYIDAEDFADLKGDKAIGFIREGNHVIPELKKGRSFPIKLYSPEEINLKFPDVHAVIPNNKKELDLIAVDAELLQKAQKILQTKCVKLEFYGQTRAIKVMPLVEGEYGEAFCIVMPRLLPN